MENIIEGFNPNTFFKKYSDTQIVRSFLKSAIQKRLPVAIWKLPGQNQMHLIMGLTENPRKVSNDLENLKEGFLFSPFIDDSGDQKIFIDAGIHLKIENGLIEVVGKNPQNENLKVDPDEALQLIHKNLSHPENSELQFFYKMAEPPFSAGEGFFVGMVETAIAEIKKGAFEKVVLSRNKKISLKKDFDLASSYLSLGKKYKNAFVSLVSIPELGTWIGASPETLIRIGSDKIFYTESLAGTQPFKEGTDISDITWTQKEIEEQALVSRYIINCFKKIRLREFEEIGPRTIVAGNVIHLRTQYIVNMEETGFPNLGTTMLQLLHPTSAVCGMPKIPARNFIQESENYDRSYYSGYLGPVHIDGTTHLFVNLRCMELLKNEAVLYAGAGILANSDPQKEWKETEFKCDTLVMGMNL